MGRKKGGRERRQDGYRQLKSGNGLVGDHTDDVNHPVLISSPTLLTAGAIT